MIVVPKEEMVKEMRGKSSEIPTHHKLFSCHPFPASGGNVKGERQIRCKFYAVK